MMGRGCFHAFATSKQSSMQTHGPHLGRRVTAALRALLPRGTPNPGPARLNPARQTQWALTAGKGLLYVLGPGAQLL